MIKEITDNKAIVKMVLELINEDAKWAIDRIQDEITYNENKYSTHKAEMKGCMVELKRLRLLLSKKIKELEK